jgi:NAD(P)-dependent dehydrogenase (short-subunit alcohol dehydrogenase family)
MRQGISVWGLSRSLVAEPTRAAHSPQQSNASALFSQTAVDLADAGALLSLVHSDQWRTHIQSADRVFLINNAGLLTPIALVGSQDDAQILQAVSANVGAALVLANAVVRAASEAADRRIVHISSGAARSAYAGWNVYCATKAALDHHARCMAIEQEGVSNPVRIASLAPGVIDTEMQAQVRSTSVEAFPMRPKFDAMKESGSLQSPQDVAKRLLTYLMSQDFGSEVVTDLRAVSAVR